MKAKLNYGALSGIVPVGGSSLQSTVAISGGEALVQRADELYQSGNEEDARAAMREALQAAMRRLDQVHGRRQPEPSVGPEVAWEPV